MAHASTAAARLTFKDPVSASTHFAGFLAGLVGFGWLMMRAAGSTRQLAVAVYGGTLVLLFLASSTYHFFDLGEAGNRWLQRVDHAAIYLFIAGTYTPVLVVCLSGVWLVGMLSLVGGLALIGAAAKLSGVRLPDRLDASLYVALGWSVLLTGRAVLSQLGPAELALLVGGGAAYTLGAIVYARERPNPWPGVFAHHEVWHVFVLVGAGAHFAAVSSVLG